MEQHDFLKYATDALARLGIPYAVVGSYACLAYGESRMTQDIDIVVDLKRDDVSALCDSFPSPEFYLDRARVFESLDLRIPFNLLHPSSGNKVDFMLPRGNDWGRGQITRSRMVRLLPDRDIRTASPEDVILGKLWYYSEGGSDKHLRDIAGILKISPELIDVAEVDRWAARLGYSELWNLIKSRVAEA